MNQEETKTLSRILKAGKEEFLSKGFLAASLRNIVKNAGVTTGAFYGYFSNKEALFTALVEKDAAAVMGSFMQAQDEFSSLPLEKQPENMGNISGKCINWCLDYIYDHYDSFKLILCCSEGTPYSNFIHQMVEVEVEDTYKFIDVLRTLGHEVPEIDRKLCHMIASGMLNAIFEVVVHDMNREQAHNFVAQMEVFYTAGWSKLLGLDL